MPYNSPTGSLSSLAAASTLAAWVTEEGSGSVWAFNGYTWTETRKGAAGEAALLLGAPSPTHAWAKVTTAAATAAVLWDGKAWASTVRCAAT